MLQFSPIGLSVSWDLMDNLMPMNAVFDRNLNFYHIGPTLKKIIGPDVKSGDNFYDHFTGRLVEHSQVHGLHAQDSDTVIKVSLINGRAKRMKANVHKLPRKVTSRSSWFTSHSMALMAIISAWFDEMLIW